MIMLTRSLEGVLIQASILIYFLSLSNSVLLCKIYRISVITIKIGFDLTKLSYTKSSAILVSKFGLLIFPISILCMNNLIRSIIFLVQS